jgi:hypothetical protein
MVMKVAHYLYVILVFVVMAVVVVVVVHRHMLVEVLNAKPDFVVVVVVRVLNDDFLQIIRHFVV